MGVPDHLTYVPRNLYAGQEATVRTRHGTDWFKIEKGVLQGWILSPCWFNLYAEYIMQNAGLDESQAGIKFASRNTKNFRYAGDTTLKLRGNEVGNKLRENNEPLDEAKRGEWKSWLETQHSKNWDNGIWSHCFMASRQGTKWKQWHFIFLGSKIIANGNCNHEIKRHLLLGRKVMIILYSIKKQRHLFANKGPYSQNHGFSNSHVWMWKLDHKEDWVPKNWFFRTVMLDKTLESPRDSKKIKPVNPKGNWPSIFIERTDAEAETPRLWPPNVKSQLIGKDPKIGNDWRQEEKGMTED